MKGWITWVGALGLLLLGIVDIAQGDLEAGIAKIVAAWTAVGIGRKIEKTK